MPLKPSQPTEAMDISSLTVESLKFSKAKRKVLQAEQVISDQLVKAGTVLLLKLPQQGCFFGFRL